uniref:Outer capsid protein VP2 n=1 Tax=Changuinola virus TaxID=40052 RepID=A0A2S0NS36_9REOV|nr:VP2 [Changuinola virus]
MTTEFTIAVADVNKTKCHGSLFNEFDVLIDTSNKAKEDSKGQWDMNAESARRNIYMWGTDRLIDHAIQGQPGEESYLCIPNNIDSVLGELKDENLENRDKIQTQVAKELKWNMNMQSQEWKTDLNNRPIVECKFGSMYARDHLFESLVFYRSPISKPYCSHITLNNFNEFIYSDLHHIAQNTIYLIDYTYKVRCVDNEPYRYPIGIIFPYKKYKKDEYEKSKNMNIFPQHFNEIIKNSYVDNELHINHGILVNDNEKLIDEDQSRYELEQNLMKLNTEIQEMELLKQSYNYINNEDGNIYLKRKKESKIDIENRIREIDEERRKCKNIRIKYIERPIRDINDELYLTTSHYSKEDSNLERYDDIVDLFNGSLDNAMKKELIGDKGSIMNFETRINMQDKGFKTADQILEEYDKIPNQEGKSTGKWLDIKRSTMGYYKKKDEYVIGYGPLKIEGILTSNKIKEMENDNKYSELIKLIRYDGDPKKTQIDANKICKLFGDYSREHINNQIDYINDENTCEKFRKSFNLLFNQGLQNERASISKIHKNGWTVHPISVKAFQNINDMSEPDYYKNIAKLGILISQIYDGYVDENCPIHTLRGGMLYANSFFGNVYDLLRDKFKWDIRKSEEYMRWNVPKNLKITPMVRMNVYKSIFIRGRAGVCWNFSWNKSVAVNVMDGYPHFNEDIGIVESIFDEMEIEKYYQKMLNVDVWDEVHVELDNLLRYDSQFYAKIITKDFYLDDKGILVTPSYYGQQIYYNVIANCNYKCVATQTNKTTEDKNEFKHTSAQRLLVPDIWFKPFQDQYDHALICQGSAVYTDQQVRGRLERTYVDAIARDQDFRDFMNISEKDIIDNLCPITYQGKYIPWKFFSQLFSLYINFMPIHIRESIQKPLNEIITYPEIQRYNINYNVTSISTAIYDIFIYGFNAKRLRSDRDTYYFLRNYQSANGEERIYLIKNNIPALYNSLSNFQNDGADEYFIINFLFLLGFVNINSYVMKEAYAPICYCRNNNILITSIKITQSGFKNFASKYFPYLSRFFGINQHKQWRNTGEILQILREKAVRYYVGEIFINISREISIRQTKLQNIAMWVGSKCGGVSEAVLIFQAITFPKASYILIVIGDVNMNYDNIYRDIMVNYQISSDSCKGVVLCKISDNNISEFKIKGTIKVRKMVRTFWGLSHDMLLIKSPGDIFGNAHIITKLMNI